jgi:hypothetical protein
VSALQDAALEVLRDLSRSRPLDPVEPLRIAAVVERRYPQIGPVTISDVYDALRCVERDHGTVREALVGEFSHGFAMTEEGLEA